MSALFLKIFNMSVSASWIVAAVLVLRLCLRRAPKWWSVLLWGIVAVRLVLPFSIESTWSLIPSIETISPADRHSGAEQRDKPGHRQLPCPRTGRKRQSAADMDFGFHGGLDCRRCAASSVFRRQLWPAALEAP